MFDISVSDWVAAEYDRQGYIGEVIDIDDNDYLINFLKKSGKLEGRYKRPRTKDEIWCDKDKIFWKLSLPPAELGKTKRSFALSEDDVININAAFAAYMNGK